jgi:hypothetical protein
MACEFYKYLTPTVPFIILSSVPFLTKTHIKNCYHKKPKGKKKKKKKKNKKNHFMGVQKKLRQKIFIKTSALLFRS